MAVMIKCKMCGGDLHLTEGSTIATCEYCGTQQTVPTQDSEKKLVQFERAERLRRNCEFDRAAGVYESIVADFRQEAEAYWGLVLCKYGIEYVDDPASGKKVPTCHRSSFESILEDANFEQTLENADVVARKIYREEAKLIEEIRKGIIEVSTREDPYDIFICYKETAEDGQRTVDSVLAQDLYDVLTTKGYRVFFSRISLEDKLGQEYEPYIFAALNSAKVMLAIGTDYEYYNAVWVKNEWSRFLKLMEKDKNKHLIPCFKGIDAYDMPKEFNKLQAQDLGKVGAVQDLLRGIDKLIAVKAAAVQPTAGVQTDDVNRIYIYNSAMEDMKSKKVKQAKEAVKKLESLGDWNDAPQQLEKAKKHLKKRKGARATRRIIVLVILLSIVGALAGTIWNEWKKNFDSGMSCMNNGQYSRAISRFDNANLYSADGVTAQEMATEARRLADLTDEKLRAFLGNGEYSAIFYSDAWLKEAVENNSVYEFEVMVNEGNSYNGYMDALGIDFYIANEMGQITYRADTDEYLYTSEDGSTCTIQVEDGVLYMGDGRVYYDILTAIDWLFAELQNLAGTEQGERVSELVLIMCNMIQSGIISNEENIAACVERMVINLEEFAENATYADRNVLAPLYDVSQYLTTFDTVSENPELLEMLELANQKYEALF